MTGEEDEVLSRAFGDQALFRCRPIDYYPQTQGITENNSWTMMIKP